jgi:hypothetical protein
MRGVAEHHFAARLEASQKRRNSIACCVDALFAQRPQRPGRAQPVSSSFCISDRLNTSRDRQGGT